MKVVVDGNTYTTIRDVDFMPEVDITGNRTPINEISVGVVTDDVIDVGQYLYLYDDLDNLWCKYWIVTADRTDKKTVTLFAQSGIKLLERDMLDPVMYAGTPISTVLASIFRVLGQSAYTVDSSFASKTISGFCPYQSAKTRLQWVCFAIGAYVKSFFSETLDIIPVDPTETLIPIEKTMWKPKLEYSDYVTAINITAYSFTFGTPTATDEWVSDGTNNWIVTRQNFRLTNPDTPESALVNEVYFEDVMLINSANVSSVLTFFGTHYFERLEADVEVINNGEYIPGDRVIFNTGLDTLASGFIDKASFSFGVQASSLLRITPAVLREGAYLTVISVFEGDDEIQNTYTLNKTKYLLPVGYAYEIENLFFDTYIKEQGTEHRIVFRPLTETISGVMVSGGDEVTVYYARALDLASHVLKIISVDEEEQDGFEVNIS